MSFKLKRFFTSKSMCILFYVCPFVIAFFYIFLQSNESHFVQTIPRHNQQIIAVDGIPTQSSTILFKGFIEVSEQFNSSTIELMWGTHQKPFFANQIRLSIPEASCSFTTKKTEIPDNTWLPLLASSSCKLAPHKKYTALVLINSPEVNKISIWSFQRIESKETVFRTRFFQRGDLSKQFSRIEKLAYLWNLPLHTMKSLMGLGFLIALYGFNPVRGIGRPFLSVFGLGVIISLTFPPFQAPDEIDHFLSYVEHFDRHDLRENTPAVARKSHFERIKFRQNEVFKSIDIENEYPQAWGKHILRTVMPQRSPTTTYLWNHIRKLDPKLDSAKTLLLIRFFNVLLFSGIAFIVFKVCKINEPHWLFGVFPSIVFFGMNVGNYALLTCFTYAFSIVLFSKIKPIYIATLVGVMLPALLFSSKTAVLLFPLIILLVALNLSRNSNCWKNSIAFLLSSIVASYPFLPLNNNSIYLGVFSLIAKKFHIDPHNSFVMTFSFLFLTWLSICALMFIFKIFELKNRASHDSKKNLLKGFIILNISTLVLSLFLTLPKLPNIEHTGNQYSIVKYILKSVVGFFTPARLYEFDFYIQSSFFSGFGWLDCMLPSSFLGIQICLFLFLSLYSTKLSRNQLNTLLVCACGAALSVSLTAFVAYKSHVNVHGRYLVGPYIMVLCGLLFPVYSSENRELKFDTKLIKTSVNRTYCLSLACSVIISYTFIFSLKRYLG